MQWNLLQRQGLYPPPPGASPILGLECAGVVAEVGAGVAGWKPGDRAMALLAGGGYAAQVVVDAGSALPVPERLTLEEAAAVPETFLTAYLNLFPLGGLAIDQQAKAFLEAQRADVGRSSLVLETAGHAGKAERDQALMGGMGEHTFSFAVQWK